MTATGEAVMIRFGDLAEARVVKDGQIAAMSASLQPMWEALSDQAREAALFRLEIVMEVVTGYREGHAELARPGEPRYPFGPSGASEARRAEAMADYLASEFELDRARSRRRAQGHYSGDSPSSSAIRSWIRRWREFGLIGLIDGRALRPRQEWNQIDPTYRDVAESMARAFDGDRSSVNIGELDRRITIALKQSGLEYKPPAKRTKSQYLSWLMHTRGSTTRTQKTQSLRKTSGYEHYPAIRPGQVIAIDATRADCLVRDLETGEVFSVEVLSAIDVATRVILALRVVPKSADAVDAGLLLYDVCRPFSMLVEGTSISDWRWCGLPDQVHLPTTIDGKTDVVPDYDTLQGEHVIPSVMPDAVRSDLGANFKSNHFQDLLASLGIDFLPTRGGRPTDNPHIERFHETLQRAWQQIPGYKGRNTGERGAKVETEALLTAHELEQHLRRFVSLDYHRTAHSGLHIPGEPNVKLTPLEMWDALTEVTGRIDVPQRADMVFDFLPIHWGVIRHDGVKVKGLVYDSECLDAYRNSRKGRFREKDASAPFCRDPHDLSRLWFRDPISGDVHEIPWRGAGLTDAPMTDALVDAAWTIVRNRDGFKRINPEHVRQLLADELSELTTHAERFSEPARIRTARLRRAQSRKDLGEAVDAAARDPLRAAPLVSEAVGSAVVDFDAPWGKLDLGDVGEQL
ncbi:integrase [Corynebacterium sp.]|uniref:integrase n=1 Tax=Corynebacterium sp. TaxID=1720 RepID=UPI0026E0ABE2|nr:integrase [Corynebacterium sp.]MDO5512284.1 integrase [Corynebacterium sp.]